jgi:nucleoid DNA-binding protein
MNRSQLIRNVAKRTNRPIGEVTEIVTLAFEEIASETLSGDRVQISGFGSFWLRSLKTAERRNPRTGESILVPEHSYPKFTPSRKFKNRAAAR